MDIDNECRQLLSSIADVILSIDLKLKAMSKGKKELYENSIEETRNFLDRLSKIVSTELSGNFSEAVITLTKKIDTFNQDIKDHLVSFSEGMKNYESKLEERIYKEINALQKKLEGKFENLQGAQLDKLDDLIFSINNLGSAITSLKGSLKEFNPGKLDQLIDRLDGFISQDKFDSKSKRRGKR